MGHIIKLPPLIRTFFCFIGLSKPANLVAFLGMFEKLCTVSLTSPPSIKDWVRVAFYREIVTFWLAEVGGGSKYKNIDQLNWW